MTIGLTCRRTVRRIKRLKDVVSAMPSAYAAFATPDFLTLSGYRVQGTKLSTCAEPAEDLQVISKDAGGDVRTGG
jgi:hypothetical protein